LGIVGLGHLNQGAWLVFFRNEACQRKENLAACGRIGGLVGLRLECGFDGGIILQARADEHALTGEERLERG
jgi:hypothetical protein